MTRQTNDLPDGELISLIKAGEQSALMDLYGRYSNAVYSIAVNVLGQSHLAEEITQDIFLKVWQRAEHWDESKGRFINWLLTITRNAAIDRARQEARRSPSIVVPLDDVLPSLGNPSVDGAGWENGQLLRELLAQLPAEQRIVIELAYYGGMSHSELAQHLALPLGTVKTRVRLGMEKLRWLWQEALQPPPNRDLS
jgi:RNA polymerase sigma-70 factor (ECF subfamily)